ncbi:hypothetical protein BGX26_000448, partial [Mortierella sp. AD094]
MPAEKDHKDSEEQENNSTTLGKRPLESEAEPAPAQDSGMSTLTPPLLLAILERLLTNHAYYPPTNNCPSIDSDDDIGPMPAAATEEVQAKKRRKPLPHEQLYISRLPSAEMYEKSYMHRDAINFIAVTKTDFIITTSVDGFLKFWKKTDQGIEFVKQYRSHLDMINVIKLDFIPSNVCWIHRRGEAQAKAAVSDSESSAIHVFDGRGEGKAMFTITKLHNGPVTTMAFNDKYNCVVSADEKGGLEYWIPDEDHELPKTVAFEYKSETDLYEFKKCKSAATSITFSQDFEKFVTMSAKDRQVRVWKTRTGKMIRKYDESLDVINEMQQ